MSANSRVAATLEKGQKVDVLMTVSGSRCWLDVSWDQKPQHHGYVSCDDVRLAAPAEAPGPGGSGAVSAGRRARIDELLELAGISGYIQSVTDPSNLRFLSNTGRIDENDAKVREVFERVLQPDAFLRLVRAYFAANYSEERVAALIEALRDPVVQKATDLERRASNPDIRAERVLYARGIKNAPATAARMKWIDRQIAAVHEVETLVELYVAETRGAARALNEVLPSSQRIPPERLEEVIAAIRREAPAQTSQTLRNVYKYTYAHLTDAEFEQYVQFVETDNVQWFNRVAAAAALQAAENVANDLISGLARIPTALSEPLRSPSEGRSAQELYEQGVALIDSDNDLEGIRYLDAAIQLKPDYAIAYYKRGNAYRNIGQTAKSMADYTQAIRFDPTMTLAYVNRANSYRDLHQLDAALRDLNSAVLSNPDVGMAWQNRAGILYELGQFPAAIRDYSQAIRLLPNDAPLYEYRGMAYGRARLWQQSLNDCNTAIRLNARDSGAYWCMGTALSNVQNYAQAVAAMNQAIALAPRTAAAYVSRGYALQKLGQVDAAMADYNRAIELDPRESEAYFNRGRVRAGRGDQQGALADYNRALSINPNYPEARCGVALAQEQLGLLPPGQGNRADCVQRFR